MLTQNALNAMIAKLPGERITEDYMRGRITDTAFFVHGRTLTVCILTLDNGFKVTGESACVDPANFNEEIGQALAQRKAIEALWPLFGFLLAEARHLRPASA